MLCASYVVRKYLLKLSNVLCKINLYLQSNYSYINTSCIIYFYDINYNNKSESQNYDLQTYDRPSNVNVIILCLYVYVVYH